MRPPYRQSLKIKLEGGMIDELVLHPKSRQLAENIIANIPHGLIIDGPNGIGVLTLSKAIARSAGSPNLVISPKKKVHGEATVDQEDGSVLIEDIRQLYERTRAKQQQHHVFIIDTGRKSMTHGAQNAFLKLLEEPRHGLTFIIATHQFDQLLPTITSRCQRLTLHPVTDDQTARFIEIFNIPDETKRVRLAFVAKGLPALIKKLAENEQLYNARVDIMKDAKAMLGNDTYQKLAVIHKYRDNRANSLLLIDDINHQIKTILRRQPEPNLIKSIDRHLEARRCIAAGGNIRLQLASCVL